MKKIFAFLKRIDWFLAGPIVVLLCISLAEIYSISLGQTGADLLFFQKQIVFVILGLALFLVFAAVDYRYIYSYYQYLYIIGAVSLVAVLLFGQTINGTRGWFSILGFGIQPVELMKIILLLCLARYFSTTSFSIRPARHVLVSGGATALCLGLVLLQPDLGSAALLFFIWLLLIIAVGLPKKYLLMIGVGLLIAFVISWQFVFKDYQRQRLLTYLTPAASSTNYNVRQAIIAVGAGGWAGRGLGFGSQSQLKFLPEANTDFIFAVIAEELGWVGVLVVIGCFGVILWRVVTLLPSIRDYFGSLFLVGAAGLIFIQMFINIGMNMGLLPVVGIPLPFVSYGGSSLLAHLMLAGIMQSILTRSAGKR